MKSESIKLWMNFERGFESEETQLSFIGHGADFEAFDDEKEKKMVMIMDSVKIPAGEKLEDRE